MFDTQFDSKEEAQMSLYISELLEKGFLVGATYHPESFELSPVASIEARTGTISSEVVETINLAKKHVYSCDWKLYWADKADGVFFWSRKGLYKKNFFPYRKSHANNFVPFFADNNISYIDIKGGYVGKSNSSGVTFSINQKWTLQKYGIFVQKIVVSNDEKGLFARTFTPRIVVSSEVYKKDTKDHKIGESKLKYIPLLLEQWIRQKQPRD